MKLGLSINSQSIETSGIVKDYKEALCEYIWNGFEAGANCVSVSHEINELGGVTSITITDDGDGISYDTLSDTFGTFLASQKAGLSLQLKSKANKGKGRFSAFSFANSIQWNTVCARDEEKIEYSILINSANKNECEISDVQKAEEKETGTVVSIIGITEIKHENLLYKELENTFLKKFAWYLYLNEEKRLIINSEVLDYSKYIDEELSTKQNIRISENDFEIDIIVWNNSISENFCTYFMNTNGDFLGKNTTKHNKNAAGFNHSVFVKSEFFENKESLFFKVDEAEESQISLNEFAEERKILKDLNIYIKNILEEIFKQHLLKQADKAIEGMEERGSFPSFSDDFFGEHKKNDLKTITTELYKFNPRIFHGLKPVQEKSLLSFLELLLNSEEREEILRIVDEIVGLTPDQRRKFSSLLKKTKLQNIIETIDFVRGRYEIIEGLKKILFDFAQYANERDNIQKIVEQNYWIFGEKYKLVTADQRMQRALDEYKYLLYGDKAPNAELEPDEEENRRMDIFLSSARKTEDADGNPLIENLIVELKAPKVMLSKKVYRQIEDYMDFVRNQPQFNSQYAKWTFIAVCREVDSFVKDRYTAFKDKGKKGLVCCSDNYELYAYTWADIFNKFDLSHSFILDKLNMDKDAVAKELEEKTKNNDPKEQVKAITQELCEKKIAVI